MDTQARIHRETMLRRAVLAGQEDAWRVWYDESYQDLARYVTWRCGGDLDRSDEVMQETWLVSVRTIRRFKPSQASFRVWLRGIAANVLRNQLRRDARYHKQYRAAMPPIDGQASEAVEAKDASQGIMAALGTLPDRHEAVLRAKYLDGLSVIEIAATWNETPKAIESLLSRARRAFRERYTQYANVANPIND